MPDAWRPIPKAQSPPRPTPARPTHNRPKAHRQTPRRQPARRTPAAGSSSAPRGSPLLTSHSTPTNDSATPSHCSGCARPRKKPTSTNSTASGISAVIIDTLTTLAPRAKAPYSTTLNSAKPLPPTTNSHPARAFNCGQSARIWRRNSNESSAVANSQRQNVNAYGDNHALPSLPVTLLVAQKSGARKSIT